MEDPPPRPRTRSLRIATLLLGATALVGSCACRVNLDGLGDLDASGTRCADSKTPIVKAATAGDAATVTREVDSGTDPDAADANHRTALYCAAANGQDDVVALLIARGARPTAKSTPEGTIFLSATDVPLGIAAERGHAGIVSRLIDAGAIVDPPDRTGPTPLERATTNGHAEVVQALLAGGANPNFAAGTAAADNRRELVALMLDAGANPVLALSAAASAGNDEIIVLVLDRGADIDGGPLGPSPLLWAAFNDRPSTVRLLLERGATADHGGLVGTDLFTQALDKINPRAGTSVRLPAGTTAQNVAPLLAAAATGNRTTVEALLDAGADPNSVAYGRFTPLHGAAVRGSAEVAQLLIGRGADRAAAAQVGALTPARLATDLGHQVLATILTPAPPGTSPTTRPPR